MRKLKFLWIDDSEEWAKSTQDNLRIICNANNINLFILPALNGEDIINQCMAFNFDAIIMD